MAERRTKEKRQEELSKKLGDLLIASQNAYTEDLSHTIKRVDDYIITFAVENSNGSYIKNSKGLDWEDPEKYGMQHFEIIVLDRDDKKFVPYLNISVRLFDKNHALITESEAPFIWHPFIPHYGFDSVIENDGEYYAEISIKSPEFPRMHKVHGRKYAENLVTKTSSIEIILPGGEEGDILN